MPTKQTSTLQLTGALPGLAKKRVQIATKRFKKAIADVCIDCDELCCDTIEALPPAKPA